VQWLVLVVVMILGGVGLAVQTIVAQAFGARRFVRASQAVWTALWGMLCVAPLFVLAGLGGRLMLVPFGFDEHIAQLAADFWLPRVAGSCFGTAAWAVMGFFNGIGRPRVTVLLTSVAALANVALNQLFIFDFGWGVAGSGWATTVAQALALMLGVPVVMFSRGFRAQYKFHLTWRPRVEQLWQQFRLGFPMGLLYAADLLGMSIFQMMQVKLGTADGAATQVVMMLTSVAYMPGFGIALAGTTLVGQSIGAGDREWAMRVGTRVTWLAAAYMGGAGAVLALAGPWILPWFASQDAEAAAMVAVGTSILWLAAVYQFFDGMNLGSGLCLRGAGDAVVPAALVLVLSWVVFVPLAHVMTFAPGQGWFDFLPQLGWGAIGGWTALLIYVCLLGVTLFVRWRSGAWKQIRI
jgi:MATE family multidrug resistance protein